MISNQLTTDRYDRLVITTWRTWDITLSYFAVSLQREIRNQETLWRLHRATLRLVTAIRVEGLDPVPSVRLARDFHQGLVPEFLELPQRGLDLPDPAEAQGPVLPGAELVGPG